ncbi:EAL domain-containing protein [Bosea sp. 117]|uniref:putative bifunctional diguanylate cyclase/phosphodiesterase n=1 Tax=Bosea sp. 117 TaxID=1125973 RepID=UPI00068B9603|nr:EAL domain-containing protein [Bosea sp. 117]
MTYPVPEKEAERLANLHALGIIDSAPSSGMEGVCALACEMLGVPFACVGLVDRDRQWLKARVGFEPEGTSREHSFSGWTIMGDELLVVPDARVDPRFATNIYVTGEPHIRFYVGAPIAVRPGLNVGSLCVFGTEPRELKPREADLVRHLANIVSDQFRLHEATRRAKLELEHRRTSQGLLEMQSRELWRRQTLLGQTERLARVGGWEFDKGAQRLTWSDGVYRIYGLNPNKSPSLDLALSHFPPEARSQLQRRLDAALQNGETFDVELPFVNVGGDHRIVRHTCDVEADGDDVIRIFGILQDITEHKEAERRMWHMANHDALTDLPNRGLMRDRLDTALRRARRSGAHVMLLLIDLDQFKDVNDSLGHDAGDALLIEAARRLNSCVREIDTVARLGGDEFIVLLDRIDNPVDGMVTAERILVELRRPFSYRRATLSCRGSIGIAMAPDHGTDPSELLKNADVALYRAKALGRGVAVQYDTAMREAAESRIQLSTRVHVALQNNEFVPYYQPTVSLKTGAIVGFEALLRWRHPRKGLLGPSEFGQVFDDPDLALAIGTSVLEMAVRDMKVWRDAGHDFGRVAVNVSSAEFARGDLAERVLSTLDGADMPPERFGIEVTESVFLGHGIDAVRSTLQTLSRAGVLIALDDFGTGYASLTHLKQFPVDRIKIDRSFIRDLEHDADDAAIVRTVINLGRSLGIKTVAEGVETVFQASYLRVNGSDFAQGYLFSKALPASRVPWLLRNWTPGRSTGLTFAADAAG